LKTVIAMLLSTLLLHAHAERLIVGGSAAVPIEDKPKEEPKAENTKKIAIGFFNPKALHVNGHDQAEIASRIEIAAKAVATREGLVAIFPSNVAVFFSDALDVTDAMQKAIDEAP
jgi:uncharacterized protein involved in high-affinity Fe2+ transport